jgi:hypothetical protein
MKISYESLRIGKIFTTQGITLHVINTVHMYGDRIKLSDENENKL